MTHEIFICYANQDKTVAEAVCSKLEKSGIQCWIAPRDVSAGKNWDAAIMDAISLSHIMVLVFSANSNDSEYCINEVHEAFDLKKEIVPLLIDNAIPHGGIALYLKRKQWIYANTSPLEQHLQKLVDEIKGHLAQATAREEAEDKAKKEAEEAKKDLEAIRIKKEAEEAAKEKAKWEAETAHARQEAEEAKKEAEEAKRAQEAAWAKREAEDTARDRKEAEVAAKEKARWEAETARARRDTEEAKEARDAALKAKKDAEKARKKPEKSGRTKAIWLSVSSGVLLAGLGIVWIMMGAGKGPVVTETTTPITTVMSENVSTQTPTPTQIPTISPTTSPALTPTVLTPKYGGTLKEITVVSPTTLAPSWMPGIPQNAGVRSPCIETLMRLNESGVPVPWLATGWEYGPDMKSLTFTLRKGVRFQDGTDFNATAVKYCLDKYRTSTYSELKTVTSIDIVDNYSIRLNLSEYQAYFLMNFTGAPGEIVSPTYIQTNIQNEQFLNNNIAAGTGPFKFVSYQKDVNIKYVRFDGYWQKGKPYLDGLEIDFFTDETSAVTAFKSGQAQTINISANTAADLQKEGKYVITGVPATVLGLTSDSSNSSSPFADIRVRRAISYAIDNAAIAEAYGHGINQASNQPAINGSWAYNKDVIGYPYNPTKAKQLLAEAGYPSGFKTKLIYVSANPLAPASIAFPSIQGYLKAIGIDAELQGVLNAQYQLAVAGGWTNGLIQCPIIGGIDNDPGKALRDVLSSQSKSFVSVLHPADYEAILAKSVIEPDFEKRKVLVQLAIKMAVDDYCLQNSIIIVKAMRASYPTVHDMKKNEIWVSQWTPEDVWISQ